MSDETNTQQAPEGETTPPAEDISVVIEREMAFDPFGKMEQNLDGGETKPEAAAAAQPPAAPAESVKPDDGGQQPAAPAAPAQPSNQPTPPVDPLASLKAELAQAHAAIASLKASQTQPAQQQQPAAPPAPKSDGLEQLYAFNMPQELSVALRSDDEATFNRGIAALMSAQAIAVHRNVVAQISRQVQEVVPQLIQRTIAETSTQEQVRRDFYGKYPQLDKPELRTLVNNVAAQVAKEQNAQAWTEGLRDAIAQRVIATVASLMPAAPTPPAPPAPPPRPPAFSTNGSPRAAITPSNPNAPGDIASTLGF